MTILPAARLAVLFGVLAVFPAQAQQAMPTGAAASGEMINRIQQQLAGLHNQLGITPAEENQWGQYVRVVLGNAQQMSDLFARRQAALPNMNAADNVQSIADGAEANSQNMHRLVMAFRQLYGAMSPEQKRVADAVFRTPSNPYQQ